MTTSPERILVHVSGDRLGDALLKYPVIRAFREAHPTTRITWVTSRRPSIFAGALAFLGEGLIDEIYAETGLGLSLTAPLPAFLAARYDIVIATERRALETVSLLRIKHDTFISPGLRFALSARKPRIAYKSLSSYDQFRVLMSLAADRPLEPTARIEVPQEVARIAAESFPATRRYAGLSPGAGGERKRWPLDNYIDLADWLAAAGFTPTFFLGPEDVAWIPLIQARVPTALFAEQLLEQRLPAGPINTIAAARHMQVSVANDSGGGHLVAAGGRPLVTLYGHTDPKKFRSPYCRHLAAGPSTPGAREVAAVPLLDITDILAQFLDDRNVLSPDSVT